MSITIKESCRKSNFLGIDFAHSFIWGDQVRNFIIRVRLVLICDLQTIRTMNDPTVNSPIGVRPDYNDVQCDDVMTRVGTDCEEP